MFRTQSLLTKLIQSLHPNPPISSEMLNRTCLNSLGQRAKRQKEIFQKLYNRFKDEMEAGWQVNFDEVAYIIEDKKESLMRLVRKLADFGYLEYHPPFKGTEIHILKRVDKKDVKLDFKALEEKLKRAYQKLDRMENYIYHFGCRQKYILDYFGDSQSKECGKCDNCLVKNGYQRKSKPPKRGRRTALEDDDSFRTRAKPKVKLNTKLTQLETYDLYSKGKSIEEIAKARGLKTNTIIQHLSYLIEKGLPVEINKFVSLAKQKKIIKTAREIGFEKLTPIKDCLGEAVSYDEIRLTLAKFKIDNK